MTREEALRKVKGYLTDCLPADCYREAEEIIEALKQEPVLDKIRAEIVDLGQRTMNDNRASGIWACRDIIDKYKAESEDEKWTT